MRHSLRLELILMLSVITFYTDPVKAGDSDLNSNEENQSQLKDREPTAWFFKKSQPKKIEIPNGVQGEPRHMLNTKLIDLSEAQKKFGAQSPVVEPPASDGITQAPPPLPPKPKKLVLAPIDDNAAQKPPQLPPKPKKLTQPPAEENGSQTPPPVPPKPKKPALAPVQDNVPLNTAPQLPPKPKKPAEVSPTDPMVDQLKESLNKRRRSQVSDSENDSDKNTDKQDWK